MRSSVLFSLGAILLALSQAGCQGCRVRPPGDSGADSGDGGAADSAPDSGGDAGSGDAGSGDGGGVDTGDRGVPVALVADGANQRFLWIRLDTADILHTLDIRALFPSYCVEGFDCVAFGSEPLRDAATDEDRALIVASVSTLEGGSTPEIPSFVAAVRLGEGGDTVDWALDSLDFTVNFADRPDICAQTTPCEAPGRPGSPDWRACTFQTTHAAVIAAETPDKVTLWLADTGKPPRALKVSLNPASTCGVVEEVIGPTTSEDWTDESGPNDLDLVEIGGEERVLLDHLNTDVAEIHGRITAWARPVADPPEQVFRYPLDGSTLMGAHNADVARGADGADYLVYAHGNGDGAHADLEAWDGEADHRGTVGIARFVDGEPRYLLDAAGPGEGFGFLRDADMLDDGTFLLTDSGCFNHTFEDCSKEGALRHVAVDFLDAEPTGRSGAFSEDHATQVIAEASLVDDVVPAELTCGFLTPYEADLRWSDELGSFLRARLDDPEGTCLETR